MKRLIVYISVLTLVVIGLTAFASAAHAAERAAPQVTYELRRSYIGPGGSGQAGIYDLSSSIGQPAAGNVASGIYTLGSGFWGGGVLVPVPTIYRLFLPLVLK